MSTERAHDFNRTRVTFIGISSRPNLVNSNLGVTATGPMNDSHDLIGFGIIVDDDFLNYDPRKPLLRPRVCAGSVPSSRQLVSKSQKRFPINLRPPPCVGIEIANAALQLIYPFQSGIPAALQFSGDQSLGWIHEFVTARRQGCFVACGF
jgi:hypothetical protein